MIGDMQRIFPRDIVMSLYILLFSFIVTRDTCGFRTHKPGLPQSKGNVVYLHLFESVQLLRPINLNMRNIFRWE